jgi:hypothetical protein
MIAWILVIALLMHDSHSFTKKMPRAMAEAIATAAAADPFDRDIKYTASLLVVFAFRESSYQSEAVGDGGKSVGAWQTPQATTPHDVAKQASYALQLMHASAVACPSDPLAQYAGGCANVNAKRISQVRIALAHELAVQP